MVTGPSGDAPASPRERIHAARYVLAAAAAALIAASALWGVPLAFTVAGIALVAAAAAIAPRRRIASSRAAEAADRQRVWPDTSTKAVVEAMPQAAFVLDGSGVVRYANARASQRFPATRPGDPFTLTFRAPEIGDALEEALGGRASSADYHEPGDATIAFSVSLNPIGPAGEGAHFLLVAFDDVSDRLAIARMRADFVANASHELRTPLASLTGFVETLLGPARNDPQATEKFLRIMLDQAQRMRRLIDDLLSLSRVEMRVHRRPTDIVDLVAVLRHVGDALAPLAEAQSVALSVQVPDGRVEVVGDRDELVQVFQNLVENGIRYGASGERVEVGMEAPAGGLVRVHVQDYGPGIPAEHLPRLTERFYRVDVGASREKKGTGLGLAIVKHILTRHRGRLDVKSEPGQGARFTVELPLSAKAI
jgi:two-component system phosphate regulon sensor histidine kinase PhoR